MEKEEDRLSNLRDDILHQIFYFAGARKALQVSILSKRWTYFWKSMPFLNFDVSEFSDTTTTTNLDNKLLSFMSSFAVLRNDNKITNLQKLRIAKLDMPKSLQVGFFLGNVYVSDFTMGPGLKEVEICSHGKTNLVENGNPPEIVRMLFDPSDFYSLHTLEIRNILSYKELDYCPELYFLVNLSINHSDFKSIMIDRMEQLEVLKLWHCRTLDGNIRVNAPNLRSLDCRQIRSNFHWTNNLSIISIEPIDITVHKDVDGNVTSMFVGLHGATSLTLSASMLEVGIRLTSKAWSLDFLQETLR